jgi:coenzyme F420-reducing hydrogenase delta subunit
MFPESFYIGAFDKGFDGIIVMSSGSDCPYRGAYKRLAERIGRVYTLMREKGIHPSRLKLTTICTVCKAAFLKEIKEMQDNLDDKAEAAA